MSQIDDIIKKQEKWNKEHPILSKIQDIYYWCYRNLNIFDWYRETKWFLQRVFRGYNDRDLWGLNEYFKETILKALKEFKKRDRMGYPALSLEDGDDENKAKDKWERILDDMIEGLEYITTESYDTEIFQKYQNKEITKEEYWKESERLYKEAEKKAMLFIKYLNNLWD